MLDTTAAPATTETTHAAPAPAPAAPAASASGATGAPEPAKAEPKTEEEFLASVYREANKDTATGATGDKPADPAGAETGERQRGADGRFLPKAGAAEGAQPVVPEARFQRDEAAPEAESDKPAANLQDQNAPTEGHFRGWSKEQREAFSKLPREAQDFALGIQKNWQGHLTRTQQELTNYAKATSPYVNVIQEHGEYLENVAATLKVPPHQIVANLMATEATLRYGTFNEKAQVLAQMAQDYGVPMRLIDADPLADPIAPGGERYAEMHDMQQEIARLRAQVEQTNRRSETSVTQAAVQNIGHFASATDENGSPRYPHFEAVRHQMGQLMASGHAATLEQAYQIAAAPIQQRIDAAITARMKAAQTAQQAGRLNVTTSATPVERFSSEEDALRHAYRQAMAN